MVFKRSEDADAAFKYCRANTMFGTFFGGFPLNDLSLIIQVVFKRSEDADAAFKYCRANTMFGNPRVRYELREVVFQEVGAKKGRPNGNAPRSPHAMTYDELLKEPANVRVAVLSSSFESDF